MKEKIERILKEKFPNATNEFIIKMTQIYLFVSEENEKTLKRKGMKRYA